MTRTIENEAQVLMPGAQELRHGVITEADLAGLPDPVRRYLRYAGVVGKEPIRTAHLKQRGAMPTKEGGKWWPMTAEQYITTEPPAFVWNGVLHPVPGIRVSATDRYADGHGSLMVKALSLIPLGNAHGPEMDQGELLRYLGETAWFPTALLANYIHWQAIDALRARATISIAGITASGIFHIDEEGHYTRITAERYREEHEQQVLRPWSGRWDAYREISGFRVPMKAEASYSLPSEEFRYFRAEITEIKFNTSVPAGRTEPVNRRES